MLDFLPCVRASLPCHAPRRRDRHCLPRPRRSRQGSLQIRIDDYTPDPRIVGDNSLTITILDAAGDPVDGATLELAETWQRIHDHGTPIETTITAGANPGELVVDQMNIVHTGSWLFRFAPAAGGNSDFVEFNFGVECPPDPGE
jgi:hypothetical protein